jgi:threonine dehydratase
MTAGPRIARRSRPGRGRARRDIVPSFDDAGMIAGQGTVGLEMAADARALGLPLDAVYVPASGGGLAAGIGLALDA